MGIVALIQYEMHQHSAKEKLPKGNSYCAHVRSFCIMCVWSVQRNLRTALSFAYNTYTFSVMQTARALFFPCIAISFNTSVQLTATYLHQALLIKLLTFTVCKSSVKQFIVASLHEIKKHLKKFKCVRYILHKIEEKK